jgi:4-hydroxy-L-threonine phosphate dehydrogenase PdxA
MFSHPKTLNLLYTLGDLSGIGPEIFFKFTRGLERISEQEWQFNKNVKIILADDLYQVKRNTALLKMGEASDISGEHSYQTLVKAHSLCLSGLADYLITGPVSKESLSLAKHYYSGQTELLAKLNKLTASDVEMLFIANGTAHNKNAEIGARQQSLKVTAHKRASSRLRRTNDRNVLRVHEDHEDDENAEIGVCEQSPNDFRIILATRHIPLNEVSKELQQNFHKVIKHSIKLLDIVFNIKSPSIGIAGLNPHAGENGLIGDEESTWMNEVIKSFRNSHPKINLTDTLPADSILAQAARAFLKGESVAHDLYISAYHDQCLPLIKGIAGYNAINMTYGLPYIRVSVDHGCAFDIAGQGIADHSALLACTNFCIQQSGRSEISDKSSLFG